MLVYKIIFAMKQFAHLFKILFLLITYSIFHCCYSGTQHEPNRLTLIDSSSSPPETPWKVTFFSNGQVLPGDSVLFSAEVAENQHVLDVFPATSDSINNILNSYNNRKEFYGLLEFILLNENHNEWIIHKNEQSRTTRDEEIILRFQTNMQAHYGIEIVPEIKDYYFFYVEKSGGIDSLRNVRHRIDDVIQKNQTFLAYFNDFVVQDSSDIMDFYNRVFTENTQPPFFQTELVNVLEALQTFLPEDNKPVNLTTALYISKLNYNSMKRGFVLPLIRQIHVLHNVNSLQVHIMTDFDVSEKQQSFEYINITKPL